MRKLIVILKSIYIIAGISPIIVLAMLTIFMFLYLIKAMLGIDFFPESHFWDLFKIP